MLLQPLTQLSDNKCKRCGLYEEDYITPDDVFDEWELCPDDFRAPSGKYIRFKDKEFNATLVCPQCTPPGEYSADSVCNVFHSSSFF